MLQLNSAKKCGTILLEPSHELLGEGRKSIGRETNGTPRDGAAAVPAALRRAVRLSGGAAGKIDNLFSFILAEEEGKLLPRRGEILSPMEDVLKANGWTEKDLEEDPLGDGQILTVPLEVEGLPEVTEQLRFESLEGDPVLSGVSYQIAPGGEPAATWKALEDQLSAVLKETDQVGLFTPDASLAQGEDVIWGDRDGNTLNISFGLDGEGQPGPAVITLHSGELTSMAVEARENR